MSVSVRNWRGRWVVDVSETVAGKRERAIKAFGKGASGKAAAESYAAEARRQLTAGTFHAWQSMTFADLWRDFTRFHLPGLRPNTAADYQTLGRLYLLPFLGERLLSEIRVRTIEEFKEHLQSEPGAKAAKGTGKALSARSVAKIIILLGTVFRFAQRRDSVDLEGQRMFVEQQATRTGETGETKTEAAFAWSRCPPISCRNSSAGSSRSARRHSSSPDTRARVRCDARAGHPRSRAAGGGNKRSRRLREPFTPGNLFAPLGYSRHAKPRLSFGEGAT